MFSATDLTIVNLLNNDSGTDTVLFIILPNPLSFIIVSTSLPRKFLPDSYGFYFPSPVEISITIGSFAMFATLFLLFIKVFPAVSIYEVKETLNPLKRPKET